MAPPVARHFGVIAAAGVLTAAAVATFAPVGQVLLSQWLSNDTYSFGLLVPFISAYLVWLTRDRLRALSIMPSPVIGTVLVAGCSLLFVLGRVTSIVGLQQIAMVLTVPSVIWLLLGRRFVLALWFPLLYLLLMLPVWDLFTNRLHYRSQLFSAHLGEQLLSLAGVAVHRSGTYLELGNITLEVASVCSGVNFLIAVIAIGVPQAYWFLAGVVPRLVVVAFAMCIALFSNGVRIAIIGIMARYHLSENIHGPGHLLQGLFVSTIGLIALQLAIRLMARRYPRVGSPGQLPFGVNAGDPAGRGSPWPLLTAVIVCVLLIVGTSRIDGRETFSDVANSLTGPPVAVGQWELVRADRPTRFVRGGPRANIAQVFKLPSGQRVELFVDSIVFTNGNGLEYRQVSLPENVMASETAITTPHGVTYVNRASYRDNDIDKHVVFWFDLNGRVTSQVITAKANALQALFRRRPELPRLVLMSYERRNDSDETVDSLDELVNAVFVALEPETALAHQGTGE